MKSAAGLHVALLRGINVGGKNKLPMEKLIEIFTAAGCQDVRSYIQSGNVVFRASQTLAHHIPELVTKRIAARFNYRIPVVLRTDDELQDVVRSNPFSRAGLDVTRLHVAFLAEKPTHAQASQLDFQRSAPDRFELRGRELYLDCPNGMARTKLTNDYFDSQLATVSTMRNWKTILKLQEMTEA